MSNYDDAMSTTEATLKWAFVVSLASALLLIIPTTLVLAVQPAWMGFQRETQKQSYQYVEAKETMLLQWINEYNSLEVEALKYDSLGKPKLVEGLRLQQGSLLARIKTEAQRIPAEALPPSVKTFLEKHPS